MLGLVKARMKRTEEKKSSFEVAFVAIKNTRNTTGYLPNQLFFLRNVWDPPLPFLEAEPSIGDMVEAWDRQKAKRVLKESDATALPGLTVGDLVRGQHSRTGEWLLGEMAMKVMHSGRLVYVKYHKSDSRLF